MRNFSAGPILVDHRDTMNTEKTKDSLAETGSLIGDFRCRCHLLFFSVFIVSLWSSPLYPLHRRGLSGWCRVMLERSRIEERSAGVGQCVHFFRLMIGPLNEDIL